MLIVNRDLWDVKDVNDYMNTSELTEPVEDLAEEEDDDDENAEF